MTPRLALAGALAPMLLIGTPAPAEWRAYISGAKPVLPARFTPMRYEVLGPAPVALPAAIPAARETAPEAPSTASAPPAPPRGFISFGFPLLDRALSPQEKSEPLAPELTQAILRIEPMYDPTRLDPAGEPPPLAVSAGTAAMDNVFGDRWRRADPDATVNAKVKAIAMAWHLRGEQPCENFTKQRRHAWGDPELTDMSEEDCRTLADYQSTGFLDAPPTPIVTAWISVPVFAAPLPGSRMTSEAFWAARRARIAEVKARYEHRWQASGPLVVQMAPKP